MLPNFTPLSPQINLWKCDPPPKRIPGRKRGGQPGNSNAFQHGLYSRRVSLSHPDLFRKPVESPRPSDIPPTQKQAWIAAPNGIVDENRLKLLEIVAIASHRLPFDEMLACTRAATIIVGNLEKATWAHYEFGGRQEHLQSLVRDLPTLLRREFVRRGIPAHLAFVPLELGNLHANLGFRDESRPLTAAQWLLLQEIFKSLREELDSERKYRRRKPLPSDRFLFEGILVKLANGLHWHDLPPEYPSRACQDLYSALIRTGRMQAVYEQLLWHLNAYGEAALRELVERGCFVIEGNRVRLSQSEAPTWEKFTALFLLQQAFLARRSIQREADLDRRRLGIFLRLPSLKLSDSSRRPTRSSYQRFHPNNLPRSRSSGGRYPPGSTSAREQSP